MIKKSFLRATVVLALIAGSFNIQGQVGSTDALQRMANDPNRTTPSFADCGVKIDCSEKPVPVTEENCLQVSKLDGDAEKILRANGAVTSRMLRTRFQGGSCFYIVAAVINKSITIAECRITGLLIYAPKPNEPRTIGVDRCKPIPSETTNRDFDFGLCMGALIDTATPSATQEDRDKAQQITPRLRDDISRLYTPAAQKCGKKLEKTDCEKLVDPEQKDFVIGASIGSRERRAFTIGDPRLKTHINGLGWCERYESSWGSK